MAEKNYIITQLQEDGSLLKLHPQTKAENVVYGNSNLQEAVSQVEGKVSTVEGQVSQLEEQVTGITGGGVVTGVKGEAETEYRKGNVNITKENLGLGNVNNVAITEDQVAQIGTNKTNVEANAAQIAINKADIATNTGNITTAQETANQALALAQQRASVHVFDTHAAMVSALKAANKTAYKVGDIILIKETNVDDYWISAVLDTNTGTYGYYELRVYEGDTPDLVDYQTKNLVTKVTVNGVEQKTVESAIQALKGYLDSVNVKAGTNETNIATNASAIQALQTKDGELQEAVNANTQKLATVEETANGAKSQSDTNKADIAKIVSGDTVVKKASQLETARNFTLEDDVTGTASFDGTGDVKISTTLKASGVTAGTYSAVTVNAKGIVTYGSQVIEVGTTGQTTPSASLAAGGLFFQEI